MKISLNWLKEFIPSFSSDSSELVDRLTYLGLEVEEVLEQKLPDSKVIVGRVAEVRPHPNADRLRICMVDTGAEELQQIVCGAPNVAEGMKVPVATIGAVLASGEESFTIKPAKIRGERSFGMICAADELGLSDDHDGVMALDEACQLGKPFADYLESDTVLDIAVTPNRSDALSHLGVARELADCHELVYPQAPVIEFNRGGGLVEVQDEEACPYYSATVIRGLTVGPSPRWLAQRLERIGLRPKNNIVDITNYILHSFGQPLHAFDMHRLAGGRIVVRSDQHVDVTALNTLRYSVEPGMLTICDARGSVEAIAGVIGGAESAVTNKTTDILLEAAYFDPASIRKTAKQLQLSTDSSYRYERGIDPCNVKRVAEYAIAMILEIAGGTLDSAEAWGSMPTTPKIVNLRPKRANAVLGSSISASEMVRLLEKICIKALSQGAVSNDADQIAFSIPSHRVDIEQEIDLIEEVARLYGYNNLEPSSAMVSSYPVCRKVPEYFPDYLRNIMIGLNFREALTNPLIRKAEASLFSSRQVSALNPISEELEVLRPSLAPSLLRVVGHNIRHGNRDLRLFEVAHSFETVPEEERSTSSTPLDGYRERELLSMVITGSRWPRSWNQPVDTVDFYDLRGAVEMLLEKLNLLDKSALNIYNDNTIGIEITLTANGKRTALKAGTVRQVSPEVLKGFDLDQSVFLTELDVSVLERCFESGVAYEPPSKFPVVERDLSFALPRHIPAQRLVDLAVQSDQLVRSVRIFDVFDRGESGSSQKAERSVAISLELADRAGTMNEETINAVVQKVSDNAKRELGAEIRQV